MITGAATVPKIPSPRAPKDWKPAKQLPPATIPIDDWTPAANEAAAIPLVVNPAAEMAAADPALTIPAAAPPTMPPKAAFARSSVKSCDGYYYYFSFDCDSDFGCYSCLDSFPVLTLNFLRLNCILLCCVTYTSLSYSKELIVVIERITRMRMYNFIDVSVLW